MSTQTALPELQDAIYAKLTGDNTFMVLVLGVFDFGAVPQNQAFPYITLGDSTEGPFNAFSTRGYEDTFTLHIWSMSRGFKECQNILARMNTLLDQPKPPLVLSTQVHVGTWYEFSTQLNDPGENDIKHMPVRYRFLTQET